MLEYVGPMQMMKSFLFATACVMAFANQAIFWIAIEPILRRLGHKYDPLSMRKYPNGHRTLWEYKRFQIAEQRTLAWWWMYWMSGWLIFAISVWWCAYV